MVVAIWSVLSIASILRPFRAVVWGVRLAAVIFCLLCLCNIDGLILLTQQQAEREHPRICNFEDAAETWNLEYPIPNPETQEHPGFCLI